jgi:hypothetical protein
MPTPFPDDHAEKGIFTATKSMRGDAKQVRAIAAVAAAGWDLLGVRREQLNDQDIGPILEEVETGQHQELKKHRRPQPHEQDY